MVTERSELFPSRVWAPFQEAMRVNMILIIEIFY